MKIAIINGANLNLQGRRQPEIYGSQTFEEYFAELKSEFPQVELAYFQSNSEGELIDAIHRYGYNYDGIIINAGGYSHTSIAMADAVAAVPADVIEVHISNLFAREEFRHHSFIARYAKGSIIGLGIDGYRLAVEWFLKNKK